VGGGGGALQTYELVYEPKYGGWSQVLVDTFFFEWVFWFTNTSWIDRKCDALRIQTTTGCNILQHAATYCNTCIPCIAHQKDCKLELIIQTLKDNTLQYAAIHCNTIEFMIDTFDDEVNCVAVRRSALQCIAVCCSCKSSSWLTHSMMNSSVLQ